MLAQSLPAAENSPTQIINLRPAGGFTNTPFVAEIMERACAYLQAGFAVHFCGPNGSGKTTLAMHLANQLARPSMLITGDDQFGSSNMIGGESGYHKRKVVDNYVRSVLKTEEDMTQRWSDSRLTIACREGFTLVYDEFTRSRPEANNVLLSVLEERLLVLPTARNGSGYYLKVHPEFSAIFTSNPEDYAGVHRTQDALRDRMITIYLDFFDRDTEVLITANRANLDFETAGVLVELIRAYREQPTVTIKPTVRAAIMLGRILQQQQLVASKFDGRFVQICLDVLTGGAVRSTDKASMEQLKKLIVGLIGDICA